MVSLLLEGRNHDQDEFAWECTTEALTELMEERDLIDVPLLITAEGRGWRKLGGKKIAWAETGADLLREILPDASCSFRVHEQPHGGLGINNFHHDSCSGKEWYWICSIKDEYCIECETLFDDTEGVRSQIAEHGMCAKCMNEYAVLA